MFTSSLAEQRRKQRLAASVIQIGPTYDIGYAAQHDRVIYSRATFRSTALVPTSESQIYGIIQDELLSQLYNIFQLDPARVEKEALVSMRLDETGIDSLLAVEVRGWFMKTLEVNVPVLKILSGIPISDLTATATEMLPDRLTLSLTQQLPKEEELKEGKWGVR